MEGFRKRGFRYGLWKKALALLLLTFPFLPAMEESSPVSLGGVKPALASPRKMKMKEPPEKPSPLAKALMDVSVTTRTDRVEVYIKTDGAISDYQSFTLGGPPRLVVDLPKMANIFAKKSIEVGNPLLKDIRIGQHPEKVRLVFTFPGTAFPTCQLSKEGQGLKLLVTRAPSELPKEEKAPLTEARQPPPVDERKSKSTDKGIEVVPPVAKEKPAVPEKRQPVEVAKIEEVQLPVKEYKGKKISLDLRDADIQTVFRMISQVSNRNIITSPDIQDKITIRLINVPWDQVLDIILAHKNWVKIEEGNVLRITTPENLPRGRQGQQK